MEEEIEETCRLQNIVDSRFLELKISLEIEWEITQRFSWQWETTKYVSSLHHANGRKRFRKAALQSIQPPYEQYFDR